MGDNKSGAQDEAQAGRQFWRLSGDGQILAMVRLTPRAAKDAIDGVEPGSSDAKGPESSSGAFLKARVRAVPEKGKANAAIAKLIAKWLGLPKSTVSVVAGGKSRIKTLALEGDPDDLQSKLLRASARLER